MRKSFSYVLLSLVVISNVSNAQNEKLSDAAKVMFSDVTTNLTNSEKNSLTDSLMLKVDKDNKLVFSNRKGKHVAIHVIPKDINNDGIDEYFVSYKEEMNDFDKGRSALFTKNKLTDNGNCTFIGNSKQIYFHSSKSHMPDIVLPNSYDGIWFVYKWNDLKENYERSDSNPSYTLDDCKSIAGLNNFDLKDNNSSIQNVSNQSMAGTIAPNAKFLDPDYCLSPFSGGSAIVRRGNKQALIDATGNFIYKPGEYYFKFDHQFPENVIRDNSSCKMVSETGAIDFDLDYNQSSLYSFFSLKNHTMGFMNPSGKIVYSIPSTTNYYKLNFYSITNKEYPGFIDYGSDFESFVNVKGEQTVKYIAGDGKYFSEYLLRFSPRTDDGSYQNGIIKYGFKNAKGEIVIPAKYDAASDFSEGLAVVGQKNEFGEMKYGFIDKAGVLVIPFTYTYQPSDFHNGLAMVTPKSNDDFNFGFINKKNELIIKIIRDSKLQQGEFVNEFYMSKSNNYIMDSTGKIFESSEFLRQFNLSPDDYFINSFFYRNGEMFIESRKNVYNANIGLIDLKKYILIPAIFNRLSYFDEVSNLAYATMFLSEDKITHEKKYREGYINREGVFVIIKQKESTF